MPLSGVMPDPKPVRAEKAAAKRTLKVHTPRKRTDEERAASELFKLVVDAEPCIGEQIPGHVCEYPNEAMHVVSQQTLRRRGLTHLVWDPVNGVNGCRRLHTRHDGCVEKIPRHLLPARCFAWAAAHDLTDALERHWPVVGV